jgi:ERCC4-type nuclease
VTSHFNVRDDGLYYADRRLGPRDALYVDTKELPTLTADDGVIRLHMPRRIDVVFVAGSRVVPCESKVGGDFVTSMYSRRLARQVRTLFDVGDVPAVILRGGVPYNERDVTDHLVRLQCIGVTLLFCPMTDRGTLEALQKYRTYLADGSRSALSAVAGTDAKSVAAPYSNGRFLLNIKGVGPKLVTKLTNELGSTVSVLSAPPNRLRKAGASPAIVKRIKEAAS